MKQSEASIKRSIRALRKMIDESRDDPILERIAYSVENALRWATEDTVGWERPEKDVTGEADILRRKLRVAALARGEATDGA